MSVGLRPIGTELISTANFPERQRFRRYAPALVAIAALIAYVGTLGRAEVIPNVLSHAASAVAVWLLGAEVLAPAGAAVAAFVFALHPVHVAAVASAAGRPECFTGLLVLTALLAHRRGSLAAPALFALALASHWGAVVFPAIAAAHDLLLCGEPHAALRGRRTLYAAYGVAALAWGGAVALGVTGPMMEASIVARPDTGLPERLFTFASSTVTQARALLFAPGLSASPQPTSGVVRTVTFGVTMGVLLMVALVYWVRRLWRQTPELAFALVWLPLTLAPIWASLLASAAVLSERALYLASVGVALAIGWVFEHAARRRQARTLALSGAVALAFTACTWIRA
jgi:protein O-mannosyl-transferase